LAGWRNDVPAFFPVSRSAHKVEKEMASRSARSNVVVLNGRESAMRGQTCVDLIFLAVTVLFFAVSIG
jgi:hypothetical protein